MHNTMYIIRVKLLVMCLLLSNILLEIHALDEQQSTRLYSANLQRIVSIMNHNVDACMDFFQHACGNYDVWQLQAANDAKVPTFLLNQEDRRQFFEEHHLQFGSAAGKLLSKLYASCRARKQKHVYSIMPLKSQWQHMLEQIKFLADKKTTHDHWPYLQHTWAELRPHLNISWITLAAQFAAHGVPSLLHIYFAEEAVFLAAPAMPNCPSMAYFKQTLQSRIQAAGRNLQIAEIVGNELWNFCRELSGEIAMSADQVPFNNDMHFLTLWPMSDYIAEFFTHLNLTAADVAAAQLIPMQGRRLYEIFNVLSIAEPRIIYNFVLWQAFEQLRYDDCYELTQQFEQILHAEYWSWHVFAKYFSRNAALGLYMFHTTRFKKQRKVNLLSIDWLEVLNAPAMRQDLNIERIILNYANKHLNAALMDADFELISSSNEIPTRFYALLLSMRKLQLQQSFYQPLLDAEDPNEAAYYVREFLHFSILYLRQPLYHYFATQNFDLWHLANLHHSTDGYYTALDCLLQQNALYAEDSDIYVALSEQQVLQIYRFYNAFVECQHDYEFWLQAESFAFTENYLLEYFELTTTRILYYAVAQLYCGRNNLSFQTLINRSFNNMPAFAAAFNCTNDAPMHPTVKCMTKRIH